MIWTISWTGIQLAIILILGVGAWRAERGLVEISSLIAFLLYAFQLLGPVTELTQNVTALQSGVAAAGRIQEISTLETEPERPVSTVAHPRSSVDGPVLSLRGVTASYGDGAPPAVIEVDLDIPRRGHTAIVGPSGAGKTTLFSLLLRFLEPSSGELLLDGAPYRSYSPAQIRARLGYVEQETPVVPGSIRDNLLFTHPSATDDELRSVLVTIEMSTVDTTLPASSVSGGQRQRIGLARAIMRPHDVLLLDEATAQVDALTEAAMHQAIRRRATDGAVVTIAHRLSTVLDADLIIVLEAGRVRAQGTHADLMARDDLYRRLVEALRIASQTEAPVKLGQP